MTPGPLSDPQSPGFPLCKASTTQGNTEMALTLCFTGRSAFILLTVLVDAHIALLLRVGKVKHRQVRSLPKVGLRQPGCRICALWHHTVLPLWTAMPCSPCHSSCLPCLCHPVLLSTQQPSAQPFCLFYSRRSFCLNCLDHGTVIAVPGQTYVLDTQLLGTNCVSLSACLPSSQQHCRCSVGGW